MVGDDCVAKTSLLSNLLAKDLSDVQSKEDLQDRLSVLRQFIDANERLAFFSQNQDRIYREELAQTGVSSNAVLVAVDAFRFNRRNQETLEANRNQAQAHLQGLLFLETNWGRWSYVTSSNLIEFDNTWMAKDYADLSDRVALAHEEVNRLQTKKHEAP